MSKQKRKMYRILAWFFSTIIAAGTLVGCGGKKYGPPVSKYGPPPHSGYSSTMNSDDSNFRNLDNNDKSLS